MKVITIGCFFLPSLLYGMSNRFQIELDCSASRNVKLEKTVYLKEVVTRFLETHNPKYRGPEDKLFTSATELDAVKEEALLEYFLLMNGCPSSLKISSPYLETIRTLKKNDLPRYRKFASGIIESLAQQHLEFRSNPFNEDSSVTCLNNQQLPGGTVSSSSVPLGMVGEIVHVPNTFQETVNFGHTLPSTPNQVAEHNSLLQRPITNKIPPIGMEFLSYMVNAGQDALVTSKNKNDFKMKMIMALCFFALLQSGGLIATGTVHR